MSVYNKADGFSLSQIGQQQPNPPITSTELRNLMGNDYGMRNIQALQEGQAAPQPSAFDSSQYGDWDQRAGFHQDATQQWAGRSLDDYMSSLGRTDYNDPRVMEGARQQQLLRNQGGAEGGGPMPWERNYLRDTSQESMWQDPDTGDKGYYNPVTDENGMITDMEARWGMDPKDIKALKTLGPMVPLGLGIGAHLGLGGLGGGATATTQTAAQQAAAAGMAGFDTLGPAAATTAAGGGAGGGVLGAFKGIGGALGIDSLGDLAKVGLPVLGAMDQRNKNEQGQEKLDETYQPYRDEAQGYMDRLRQSYDDPNSFLEGPEYQAAQNVMHNKISRADAARGLNANSIGREKLLQDHAMAGLSNYRQGLAQNMANLGQIATGSNSMNSILNNQGKNQPYYDLAGKFLGAGETRDQEGKDEDALNKLIDDLIGGL